MRGFLGARGGILSCKNTYSPRGNMDNYFFGTIHTIHKQSNSEDFFHDGKTLSRRLGRKIKKSGQLLPYACIIVRIDE